MKSRPPSLRSAINAVALQWAMRGFGLISLVVLARMLSPADFGIVGLAMTAVAVVEIFSYIGLRQVLIRMPDPDRSYLDSAWTIQLALFTFLGLALASSAPWVATFYGEAAVEPVVMALSLRFVLLGLVNIGIVDFDRHFLFGRDLVMRLFGRIVSLVTAVLIAMIYQSYWALIAGILAQGICLTVASYVMHPFRPRFSLKRRRELIGMSAWMFTSSAAQIIHTQADRVALGRYANPESVGAFAVSKDLSDIFTHEIATALNRVSFVETSRSGALATQGTRLGGLLGSYGLIVAPLGLGVASVAPEFFTVFLGNQWDVAAQLTIVLAPAGAIYAVSKLVISSLQAAGREQVAAFISIGTMILTVAALGIAVFGGATGPTDIARVTLITSMVGLVVGLAVLAHQSKYRMLPMLWHVARPFLAALLMFAVLQRLNGLELAPGFALVGKVAVGVPVYFAAVALLWAVGGRPTGAETVGAGIFRQSLGRTKSILWRA